MAAEKPTFVFVPGSLHTPAHYNPTMNALQALDYPCIGMFLSNIGPGASTASPYDPERQTRAELEARIVKEGKEVILVGHSSGGVVASQVVKGLERSARAQQGLSGGIIHVVFLCALLYPEGHVPQQPGVAVPFMLFDGKFTRPGPAEACIDAFYHDLPEVEAELWASQLEIMDNNRFGHPVKGTCWDLDVPKTYVHTLNDRALPMSAQTRIVEGIQDSSMNIKSMNCGHSPFLSNIDELVMLLTSDLEKDRGQSSSSKGSSTGTPLSTSGHSTPVTVNTSVEVTAHTPDTASNSHATERQPQSHKTAV